MKLYALWKNPQQKIVIIALLTIISTIYFYFFASRHLCLYMHVSGRKKEKWDREKASRREREIQIVVFV